MNTLADTLGEVIVVHAANSIHYHGFTVLNNDISFNLTVPNFNPKEILKSFPNSFLKC